MKIQIISKKSGGQRGIPNIDLSPLSQPKSLDEYDVNIIDLSAESLWVYEKYEFTSIDDLNDICSIQQVITNSTKASVIIVLPKNCTCKFYYSSNFHRYNSGAKLKDYLSVFIGVVLRTLMPTNVRVGEVLFENTRTYISGIEYEADFYLNVLSGHRVLTKSHLSDKVTTVALTDKLMVTTLNVASTQDCVTNFVKAIFAPKSAEEKPAWLSDVLFYDDTLQNEIIREREAEVERAKLAINEAQEKLRSNDRYKSVLYTNGDELVSVVFEMLEKMLGCDLSDFDDVRNEDFLIRAENYTLIGEIKGVTSNVKNDHVGQIEHHYQRYMDELEDKGLTEDVHQILIINPFRTKAPTMREPVHEKQIALAERNGCLIIETATLLKMFEAFLENRLTSAQCVKLFCERTGILTVTDIPAERAGDLECFV